jgi:hypothetical protein
MPCAPRSEGGAVIQSSKIPARALLNGDHVASGETIVSVSAGVRTPRGMVEVTLEKDGRYRRALWGAFTIITVRRSTQ